jgi:hypothetical protein
MDYIALLDLGISFGQMFLEKIKNRAPSDLLSASQAFLDAAIAHKNDVISRANLEAQRG